ncbi:sodium-dependent transporter [Allobacillus sp. SKP8-2]|uniref:Sodium-dependent transporter n=2 Tax=Bacillaceae TaxID=186817 RepID=A0A941HU55_9BACI|nr:sodium-dependent transporter [Allobacillus saliphilus]MBR7554530.1 sodium-dependent transporter [Allobacillus saliphilus]
MKKDEWKSRLGFMLAAMGSAVGLGNIWRFSYVAGENGGATFLLIYIFFILAFGIPLLLAEFSVGKAGKKDAVGSFMRLAPGTKWHWTGVMGVIGGTLILSFYSVVSGWSLYYLFHYLIGDFWTEPTGGFGQGFEDWTSSTWGPLIWQFLFMVAVVFVVIRGIKRGIERANLIAMPALAILMVVLAVYSLTLDGASEGLAFLFTPDWSQLSNPQVYLAAMGQAFFSLSLGISGMLTYASYLKSKDRLPAATVGIGVMDTVFAVIAGIVIFPAVFSFGVDVQSGPPLVFITLPSIFASMPAGGLVGTAFFVLLVMAAYSSALSMLEIPVAFFHRTLGLSRKAASILCGSVIFAIGITVSIGYGILSHVTIVGNKGILDSIDYVTGNFILPLGAMLIAIFVGWYWTKDQAIKSSEINNHSLQSIWYFIVRYIAPVVVLVVAITSIFG